MPGQGGEKGGEGQSGTVLDVPLILSSLHGTMLPSQLVLFLFFIFNDKCQAGISRGQHPTQPQDPKGTNLPEFLNGIPHSNPFSYSRSSGEFFFDLYFGSMGYQVAYGNQSF